MALGRILFPTQFFSFILSGFIKRRTHFQYYRKIVFMFLNPQSNHFKCLRKIKYFDILLTIFPLQYPEPQQKKRFCYFYPQISKSPEIKHLSCPVTFFGKCPTLMRVLEHVCVCVCVGSRRSISRRAIDVTWLILWCFCCKLGFIPSCFPAFESFQGSNCIFFN